MCRTKFVTLALGILLFFNSQGALASGGLRIYPGCVDALIEAAKRGEILAKVDNDGKLHGPTEYGLKKLNEEFPKFRQSEFLQKYRYLQREAAIENVSFGKTGAFNILMLGKKSSGKTSIITFSTPENELWVRQAHELQKEIEYIGGQTEAGFKAGRDERNWKETIDEAVYALIDEGEKSNVIIQQLLLSLLEERAIYVNGRKVDAKELRSIIFTGNGNLADMLLKFVLSGQPTTGEAFLNRFAIKMNLPDWLDTPNMRRMQDLEAREKLLLALGRSNPELLKDLVFQRPERVDYKILEEFAYDWFRCSPELLGAIEAFAKTYRDILIKQVNDSEAKISKKDPDEPFQFTPAADLAIRIAKELQNAIIISAALDFIRSPLANAESLETNLQEPIILSTLSLWRTYSILVPIGENRVIFDPFQRQVHFGAKLDNFGKLIPQATLAEAKDGIKTKKAQALYRHDLWQYEQFNEHLKDRLGHIDAAARVKLMINGKANSDDLDLPDNKNMDFELRLAVQGGTSVMELDYTASSTLQNMQQNVKPKRSGP